jgi:PAS domain S-box-containing protein
VSSELVQQMLNLQNGDHLCLFYDKDPAEQMPALVPFIQDALSKDECFIYIADDQTVEELAHRLEQSGVHVAEEAHRGALKLWTRREWRQPGRLNPRRKLRQVSQFVDEAANSGFKGTRFAVEMTWTLGPDISAAKLERWEATLNTIFIPGFPGRIICQYNRSRISPEVMIAALRTHPLAILGNQVHPNCFYEAPLVLRDNGRSNTARLDWMVSVLRQIRAAQRQREELIEKRAALTEAERSIKKVEAILSLMPAAVYTCDHEGRITYFNRRAAEIWGCEPQLNAAEEKFCGSFRLWRSDASPLRHNETPMALAVRTGKSTRDEEVIMERADGSRAFITVNVDPLYDAAGRPSGAINAFQDVTELKKAEQASRSLAAIVESSDDAILSKDLNGIITSWNQGAERLFGYTSDEIVGQSVLVLIPPERYDEERDILERIRRGERVDHYETVRRCKDGSLIEISLTISPIKDNKGEVSGASTIARDITERKKHEAALRQVTDALEELNQELERRVRERTAELERTNAALLSEMEEQKRLEEQLRQAQKMESVGTLAGGIAHDFNNMLNIIKGYASLIRHQTSRGEHIDESLTVIDETIGRGAELVRQLLALARKTESQLLSTNVNDLVSELSKLLQQTFSKTIDIVLELDAKLPPVLADPHQISQALLNLSVNARDAMPTGGRLSLRTKTVDGRKVPHQTVRAEQYVCVEVADAGTGIDAKIRERIFEPFFTTKGIGEGTGLGLAIVYGTVKNHNGFIDVESELGRGTTFRLYLPVAAVEEKRTVDEIPKKAVSARIVNGRGTILLVEDEKLMVALLKDALLQSGYHVLVALNGEEAIDLYRRHKADIGLVLLDLGLPKVGGWDVILKMKQENPNVKVIVISGYIEPAFKSKMSAAGVRAFVEKPYIHEELLQLLHDTIVEKTSTIETFTKEKADA